MLKDLVWPEAIGMLERYSQTHADRFRTLAMIALMSMLLVSAVPYIAGTFISSLVNMEEDQGIIDMGFIVDTATVIVLIITFWYITTALVQRETTLMS